MQWSQHKDTILQHSLLPRQELCMHATAMVYFYYLILVDGGWTDWCPHECSATCGGGIRNFTRTCTNPAPSCNGSMCAGDDFRTEKCNMHCCLGIATVLVKTLHVI